MLANTSWQILVLASAVVQTMGNSLTKYQVDRASAFQVLIYKYIASAGLMTFFWLLGGETLPTNWLIIFIYGFIGGISVAAYTAATRHSLSKTVLTTPISRLLAILWSGILLGEFWLFDIGTINGKLSLLGVMLIPLIFILFYEKNDDVRRWNKLIWFSILWVSFVPPIAKLLMNTTSVLAMLTVAYWGSLSSSLLISVLKSHKLYLGKRFAGVGLSHGVINSIGTLLWFTALSKAMVTQAILLRLPVLVLLTTLVGLYVYKEKTKLTKRKMIGMGAAALLVVIILIINH